MVTITEIESEDEFEKEPLVAEASEPPTSASESVDPPSDQDATGFQKYQEMWDPLTWGAMILAVLMAMVIVRLSTPTVMKPKLWNSEELAKYNGSDPKLPILLGIMGSEVFLMCPKAGTTMDRKGVIHISPEEMQVGHSFLAISLVGDGLSDSLEGLSALQVKSIMDWHKFFENSTKYIYVGKLVGRFYDESGLPTKEFVRATRLASRGERLVKEQKEDESRFPSCNSRWNPQQGGEVWCTTGYPRIAERISDGLYKGAVETRCACFEEDVMNKRKGLREYDGCPPLSQRCQSAPPQA
ncbi:hypothetical protein AXG93_1544s1190 [Marchantia polymorpha subsp. ruderalis]|uniref:Cytochrome b5 heme-binding domain-containing protein n=1 Tax=Marchantia polymorpha subsp. ruderalis TaxID=1480154 RepID=A0A176VRQ4_MARPO|nr:hypothetical protein AXG93_1544s1190 [Marchantia polymorpha subsp. ruderalis]